MPLGDVWIVGAGASAEAGAPTISAFREAARDVIAGADGAERDALEAVWRFWNQKLPAFNVEELFGFVDSELGQVSGEGDLVDMRNKTLFLIVKVITERLRGGVSDLHIRFVDHLEDWVPIITLNWDILLDNAILGTQRRRVSYVLPKKPDYDPTGKGLRSQKLLKLHGSLNWLYCDECKNATVLGNKESAVRFLGGNRTSLECETCHAYDKADILMVPPVLGKLQKGNLVMQSIWSDAYKVLRDARRVFIVGYSFPPADIQTRLFVSKALFEASHLQRIKVITRPKFGTARTQFEDRYTEVLQSSEKVDLLEFEYSAFGQYVDSPRFERDLSPEN